MAIDFKEIPNAGQGPDRDAWEFFAQDFLIALGFEIESQPARGADGGKDMLVIEHLPGVSGTHKFRWLVSCKHNAHSGKTVGTSDEANLSNRLDRYAADGFLGFYSTLSSQSLLDEITSVCEGRKKRVNIFTRNEIERHLTQNAGMRLLFRRFFPASHHKWMQSAENPSNLWPAYIPLKCEVCGRDLLTAVPAEKPPANVRLRYEQTRDGNLVLMEDRESEAICKVYVACKGDCDRVLERSNLMSMKGWWDVNELCGVEGFLMFWCVLVRDREKLPPEVARKVCQYMMCFAQFVMRDPLPPPPGFGRYTETIEDLLEAIFGSPKATD